MRCKGVGASVVSEFSFTGLGGVSEVGASCYLYGFGDTRLLIDAGTRPNALGNDSLPELSKLDRAPDAVLLTHAHSDHIGALPLLKKRFPKTPVYATRPTARIALDMLKDAVKVQQSQGAPLYALSDVTRSLKDVTYLEPFETSSRSRPQSHPLPGRSPPGGGLFFTRGGARHALSHRRREQHVWLPDRRRLHRRRRLL